MTPNGMVLCVDQSFSDYAGWGATDLIAKPFSGLAVNPGPIDK